MWRPVLIACSLMVFSGVSSAQGVPERHLPAGSQIFLRWDGMEKNRAAFEKTAVGKMLKDGTGEFLAALWKYGNELLEFGLRQADPKAGAIAKEIPLILSGVHEHGFLLGIEIKSLTPPQGDVVLVFPKAGGSKGHIVPLAGKLAGAAKAKVRKTTVGERTIHEIGDLQVHFGWWEDASG